MVSFENLGGLSAAYMWFLTGRSFQHLPHRCTSLLHQDAVMTRVPLLAVTNELHSLWKGFIENAEEPT